MNTTMMGMMTITGIQTRKRKVPRKITKLKLDTMSDRCPEIYIADASVEVRYHVLHAWGNSL